MPYSDIVFHIWSAVLFRCYVQQSKYDTIVEEAEWFEVNFLYSYICFHHGKEKISFKNLSQADHFEKIACPKFRNWVWTPDNLNASQNNISHDEFSNQKAVQNGVESIAPVGVSLIPQPQGILIVLIIRLHYANLSL